MKRPQKPVVVRRPTRAEWVAVLGEAGFAKLAAAFGSEVIRIPLENPPPPPVAARRAEVAALLRQGLATREIASRLGVSVRRVQQLVADPRLFDPLPAEQEGPGS